MKPVFSEPQLRPSFSQVALKYYEAGATTGGVSSDAAAGGRVGQGAKARFTATKTGNNFPRWEEEFARAGDQPSRSKISKSIGLVE